MNIELRPVTKSNFEAIIQLEVSHDQQHYVASNLYSIANQWCFRNAFRWRFMTVTARLDS